MIGVIADDVTGATDVGAVLSSAGLRTLLALTPEVGEEVAGADAVVIGLKTRSIPAADAVAQSLAALDALQRLGVDRFYVKYCSTFDSTADGNIGPVTEALAARLGVRTVVTTPAAPLHGRTVYRGYLFVDDLLLHETHMSEHPLTPMRDSSVPRLLSAQAHGRVGLLPLGDVRAGATRIREALGAAEAAGCAHLVADAVTDEDLAAIAEAVQRGVLVAGSAGLIGALARHSPGLREDAQRLPATRAAIIAGSCSQRTLEQIGRFRDTGDPAYQLVAALGETATELSERALAWWDAQPAGSSGLIFSSSPAQERERSAPGAAVLYEKAAGLIAVGLVARGIRRVLIAGGETSGEVIKALGVRVAVVGEEAAPGVPWIHDTERDVHLILKSGNFGGPDLFADIAREGGRS